MPPTITDMGVGGIFALLVIREVLSFLSARKNGTSLIPNPPLTKEDTGPLDEYKCRATECDFSASKDEMLHLLREINKGITVIAAKGNNG